MFLQHDAVRRVRSHGAMSGCVIGIRVLKRLNITSDFFTLCYPIILFFNTKYYGEMPTGSPLTWASNADGDRGMKKSRFSANVLLYFGNDTRYGYSFS